MNLLGFSFKRMFGPTSSVAELMEALDKLGSVVGKLLAGRRCEACEEVSDNLKDIHTRIEKYVSSVMKVPSTAGMYGRHTYVANQYWVFTCTALLIIQYNTIAV